MTISAFIPSSEMIFTTVEKDRRRLLEYCRNLDKADLRLDLGNVSQCDSAGLAFLIEARRLARNYKKVCHFEGMTKAIHALAEFCGVDKMLMNSTDEHTSPCVKTSNGGFVTSAPDFSDEPTLPVCSKSVIKNELLHD